MVYQMMVDTSEEDGVGVEEQRMERFGVGQTMVFFINEVLNIEETAMVIGPKSE